MIIPQTVKKYQSESERGDFHAAALLELDKIVVVARMVDNSVVANLDYSVGDGVDYLIVVRAKQHVALEIRKSVVDGGYGLEVEVVRRLIENENIRAEEHHA